jgi:hypothetical protein
MLFDACLSQIKNQFCDCLCQVTHAIQAAVHQRFAVDYLNPSDMAALLKTLEDQGDEAG